MPLVLVYKFTYVFHIGDTRIYQVQGDAPSWAVSALNAHKVGSHDWLSFSTCIRMPFCTSDQNLSSLGQSQTGLPSVGSAV